MSAPQKIWVDYERDMFSFSEDAPTSSCPASVTAYHHDDVVRELVEALTGLEYACEQLAATRTHEVYLAMIDNGQSQALLSLDARRASARAALAKIAQEV